MRIFILPPLAVLLAYINNSIHVEKCICSKKKLRNSLTVRKTVERCQNYSIPYPKTLNRTIPYLNTLSRTIPFLDTLSPFLIHGSQSHSSRQQIRNEYYVTRELSARVDVPSRISARVGPL